MLPIIQKVANEIQSAITSKEKMDSESSIQKMHEDPFKKENVKSVQIIFQDFWSRNEWTATGYVKFQSKDTTGEQKFEANTIENVLIKIASFIKTL